jgi:hypothetical protein
MSREAGWGTRLAIEDVSIPSVGKRRLQLVISPARSEGVAWEIRRFGDEWTLYRSRVAKAWPIKLRGYEAVSIASNVLSSFFSRVVKLSLPISPDLSNSGGLDGTIMQLALFGDLSSECRFQWWSRSAPKWKRLTEIASEMAATFSAAQAAQSTES